MSLAAAPSPALPPLIDAAALRALLAPSTPSTPSASDDLLLLDCRFNLADAAAGEAAWQAGHITGALYAHLDRDLSGPKTGQGTPQFNGRHPLPTPQALADTLGAWGLRPETRVVAYDDAGGMFAARAWWLLRWLGHDRVQVLDGGWSAWLAAGGPVDTLTAPRTPCTFTPQVRSGWRVLADEVLASVQAPADAPDRLQLLDARAPDRFGGENETLDPVGGHIPGAHNRFFQNNLCEGRFKLAEVLREEFTALLQGQPLDAALPRLVHQCGSGVTACHNLVAMEVAGLTGAALYPGSWSEWCANPDRPVATGG